ncbi:hypothetical protein ALO79_200345 [Pseudomonas syringae pv. castaneae]|uniref:Uncharacterized protein n=1 Tax=Pseudomonas syringae pv. castaneae TaxID=264450 RepID=A0A0P9MH29_PSESX|nr:hypothetical protein ALO79_200345 [Pseudomonas syringae pv. castaneae]
MLACRSKFGPVPGDRGVQLQLAFGNQLQGSDGGEGLGAGKQIGDGIAVPGFMTVLVSRTGPQIDHRPAADLDAQRRTALLGIIEQCCERFAYRLELKLIMALNLHPQLL